MYKLYAFGPSGNSYKCHLLLHHLGLPHETIEVDILAGASRTPAFLGKNPIGRIPVLEDEHGRTLAESHAILNFLAEGSPFLPTDSWLRAKVWEWMCFEQYNLEPTVAVLRFWRHYPQRAPQPGSEIYKLKQAGAVEALGILEQGLQDKQFLVGERYTIADIALFGYTHMAHEAGYPLDGYPNISRWLGLVRDQPGFISLDA